MRPQHPNLQAFQRRLLAHAMRILEGPHESSTSPTCCGFFGDQESMQTDSAADTNPTIRIKLTERFE